MCVAMGQMLPVTLGGRLEGLLRRRRDPIRSPRRRCSFEDGQAALLHQFDEVASKPATCSRWLQSQLRPHGQPHQQELPLALQVVAALLVLVLERQTIKLAQVEPQDMVHFLHIMHQQQHQPILMVLKVNHGMAVLWLIWREVLVKEELRLLEVLDKMAQMLIVVLVGYILEAL